MMLHSISKKRQTCRSSCKWTVHPSTRTRLPRCSCICRLCKRGARMTPKEMHPIKRVMAKSPYAPDRVEAIFSSPLTTTSTDISHTTSDHTELSRGRIDTAALQAAMEIEFANPRISLYSPIAATILEYLDRTTPQFCKNETGATCLNRALKDAFPELWSAITAKNATDPIWIEHNRNRRESTRKRDEI